MKALQIIRNLPAIQAIIKLGGEIFLVGGIVRDHYLGKESKDIDIIVRLVPLQMVISTLSQFGQVEVVGESYGVIKFIPVGWTSEPIDVALPRTDKKIVGAVGHKAFDVQADENLSIETDLLRRDITVNSIAVGLDGNIIDPVGGLKDLTDKVIRATSPQSFSDDPLRMLRCVQFAARFMFEIEKETLQMITKHAQSITEITPERIREELDKLQSKSDEAGALKGLRFLNTTGISSALFGQTLEFTPRIKIDNRAQFYTSLLHSLADPAEAFKIKLKGDNITGRIIHGLTTILRGYDTSDTIFKRRLRAVHTLKISHDSILEMSAWITLVGSDLDAMPKRITELSVNGNDLMELGFQGKALGDAMNFLFLAVLEEKVVNEKDALLTFISK